MPVYEFECQTCSEVTERLQKVSDPPPDKCDACGSDQLKRVISRTSFQLKGSGWYVTDYKKSSQTTKDKPSEPTKNSDKKADASSDKTPVKKEKADAKTSKKKDSK